MNEDKVREIKQHKERHKYKQQQQQHSNKNMKQQTTRSFMNQHQHQQFNRQQHPMMNRYNSRNFRERLFGQQHHYHQHPHLNLDQVYHTIKTFGQFTSQKLQSIIEKVSEFQRNNNYSSSDNTTRLLSEEDYGLAGALQLSSSTTYYHQLEDQDDQDLTQSQNNQTTFIVLSSQKKKPTSNLVAGGGAHHEKHPPIPQNLDLFLISIYNYFLEGGYTQIMFRGILELFSLFFTIFASLFLVSLDWNKLWECQDEHTCKPKFSDYIVLLGQQQDNTLSEEEESASQHHSYHSSTSISLTSIVWKFYVWLYFILFFIYGIFCISQYLRKIQDAKFAKLFYEDYLGFPERRVSSFSLEWEDVVMKIQELYETGGFRFTSLPPPSTQAQEIILSQQQNQLHHNSQEHHHHQQHILDLDALAIANRILRKENFLVGFFNLPELLDLSLPEIPFLGTYLPINSRQQYLSKNLEWSLHTCILNHIFSEKYRIRPEFYTNSLQLKRRFVFWGILQGIFMPFLGIFITLHFLFGNLHEYKSGGSGASGGSMQQKQREWTPHAKWLFREFNELPHFFERRLNGGKSRAENYLGKIPQSPLLIFVGKILVFLSGSILSILVVLAAMNDAILLHVKIGQWNLLWYVGIFGMVFSFGRGMSQTQENNTEKHDGYYYNNNNKDERDEVSLLPKKGLFQEMNESLAHISQYTHYMPYHWHKRGFHPDIQKEFMGLYKHKPQLFLQELISVVTTPLLLIWKLPQNAERICQFVSLTKREIGPGVQGEVCGFASFDFDEFEDEYYYSKDVGKDGTATTTHTANAETNTAAATTTTNNNNNFDPSSLSSYTPWYDTYGTKPKTKMGKMKKSFFTFKSNHPNWKCQVHSGKILSLKMEKFKENRFKEKRMRERQYHLEVVKRQLDMLRVLEQEQQIIRQAQEKQQQMQQQEEYVEVDSSQVQDQQAQNHTGLMLDHFRSPHSNDDQNNFLEESNHPHPLAQHHDIMSTSVVPIHGDNTITLSQHHQQFMNTNTDNDGSEIIPSPPSSPSMMMSHTTQTRFSSDPVSASSASLNRSSMHTNNVNTNINHSSINPNDVSVLHYADVGLSRELEKLSANIIGGDTSNNPLASLLLAKSLFASQQSPSILNNSRTSQPYFNSNRGMNNNNISSNSMASFGTIQEETFGDNNNDDLNESAVSTSLSEMSNILSNATSASDTDSQTQQIIMKRSTMQGLLEDHLWLDQYQSHIMENNDDSGNSM